MQRGDLLLLYTLAERLAQVQLKTRSETMTDVKAEAIVNILAITVAEVKPETLSDNLTFVKAGELDEIMEAKPKA